VSTEQAGRLRSSLSWPGVVGLGVFVTALWAQGNTMVGVFYDDGIYVTAAKALAEGLGYRNIHLPGVPLPIVHYPPLYPLWLSLLWRLWPQFPANVALFALGDAAFLGLAAWITARHLHRRLPLPGPVVLAVLAAGFVNFPLLTLVSLRMSEALFLMLLAAAVTVADRREAGVREGILAGALAGLATETKSVGVAVLAGVVLSLWLRRRRPASLAAAVAGAVVVAPWIIWVLLHAGQIDHRLANYTTYLSELHDAGLASVLGGLKGRALSPIFDIAVPHVRLWLRRPLGWLLIAALAWGVARSARRAPALIATLLCYFVIISLWPFPPNRFIWVILPWILLFIAVGCWAAWRQPRWGRALVAVIALTVAIGYVRLEGVALWRHTFLTTNRQISRSFQLLVPAIATELPPDAVIASEDEALVYLYSGRHTVPSNLFHWQGLGTEPFSTAEHVRIWCQMGVTYLAVTAPGDHATGIVAAFSQRPDSVFTPLFHVTKAGTLYRFRCPD
jgi:hypothetical protein